MAFNYVPTDQHGMPQQPYPAAPYPNSYAHQNPSQYQSAFNFLPVDQVQSSDSNFQFVPVMQGMPVQQESSTPTVSIQDLPSVKPHKGQILTARDQAGNATFRFVPQDGEDEEDADVHEFDFSALIKDDEGKSTAILPKSKTEQNNNQNKIGEIGEKIMTGFSNSLTKLGSLLNIFSLDEDGEDESKIETPKLKKTLSFSKEDKKQLVVVAEQDGGGSTMVVTPGGNNFLVPVPKSVRQGSYQNNENTPSLLTTPGDSFLVDLDDEYDYGPPEHQRS